MEMTLNNGKLVMVQSNEELLQSISVALQEKDDVIEQLTADIEELKNDKYKDEELQRMNEEVEIMKNRMESMRNSMRRGFPISEDEEKKIAEWQDEHLRKKHWDKKNDCAQSVGAIGGRFSYHFIPTSIGIIGEVHCACGKKFCFQEIF